MGVSVKRFQSMGFLVLQLTTVAGAVSAATVSVADQGLVPYGVVDGAIPKSLTGVAGDPAKGQQIVADRRLGNCLSCHTTPITDEPDQGNVGPDLHGVGRRLTESQLRLRVVNEKLVNPATIMPAFYRVNGLRQVATDFAGKPMLTAQQVEDVVAYLVTLK